MAKLWVSYSFQEANAATGVGECILDLPFNDICSVQQLTQVRDLIKTKVGETTRVVIVNWKAFLC